MDSSVNRELRIAAILFMTFGTAMLDRMTQVFLGPSLVRDLQLTNSQIGVLSAALSIGWALSTFLFGLVSDRIGRKKVLVPAVIAFSLLSVLSGLARTYGELLAVRALLGVAEGPCWSVILALMEGSSAPERRGRNLGIVNSAGTLVGSAIAPVFSTQIAVAFGWRAAFFAAAIPGLACAYLIARYVPEPERTPMQGTRRPLDYRALIRRVDIWLCFVAAFFMASWLFGFSVFAPLYLTHVAGMSETSAGFVMGVSGLGGFASALVWPVLSDRAGRRPMLICTAFIAALLPLACMLPILRGMNWVLATAVFAFTAGPAVAAFVMVIIPVESVTRGLAATAIGFVALGADLLGATIGPVAGGVLADRLGLQAPLLMATACALLIVVVSLAIRETAPSIAGPRAE